MNGKCNLTGARCGVTDSDRWNTKVWQKQDVSFLPFFLFHPYTNLVKINLVLLGLLGFLRYMYIGRGILTGETVFAPSRWISVEGLISTLGETKVEITNRKLSSLPDVSFNLEGGNLLESLKSGNFPATRIFLLSAAQMPWGVIAV